MTAWQTKLAVSGEGSLELTTTKDTAWQAAGQRVLPPFASRAKMDASAPGPAAIAAFRQGAKTTYTRPSS